MILYCIISAFANALTSAVLAGVVLLRRKPGQPNWPFLLVSVSVCTWSTFYLLWQLSESASQALFWSRSLTAAAIFVPPTYYQLALRLSGNSAPVRLAAGYLIAAVFAVLSATPLICEDVIPLMGFPFWPQAGMLYWAYLLVWFVYQGFAITALVNAFRSGSPSRRNQLKYVILGTVIASVGGATNFPLWYRVPFPPVGNVLVVMYVVGVAYSIIRFRLLEVNYVTTKLAAYLFVVVPVALVHPFAFLAINRLAPEESQRFFAWLIASFILSGLALFTLPPLRSRIDRFLEATLLRRFLTGRDQLRGLGREVGGLREESAIFNRAVEIFSQALDAPAGVFIRGELDSKYRLEARQDAGSAWPLPEAVTDADPLLQDVKESLRATLTGEISRARPELWARVRGESMLHHVEVAVPVHADDVFFGLLVMGQRKRGRIYTEDEIALLESACLQVGLHARARQIERRAYQSEKLISLGTLAAGLAHEMRNPLVSIKTFAGLLGEARADPDFQREFSSTVLRDVGRIESIIENVAAFATDRKVAFSWIRVDEVVRGAHEITEAAFLASGVMFRFEATEVSLVRGNHNQLTQVLINLLNNAVQAIGRREGGLVVVRLSQRTDERHGTLVEIVVEDNGPGVDPEVLPRMFEPFATTKDTGDRGRKGGMGLGLAIVKRIVDGHSGFIGVQSKPGVGTTFTITFPTGTTLP